MEATKDSAKLTQTKGGENDPPEKAHPATNDLHGRRRDEHASGRLELIFGPMYAGKSTELIRRYRRYAVLKKNVLAICPEKDTRSGECIATHNGERVNAFVVKNLSDVLLMEGPQRHAYLSASVVAIDECQFFDDVLDSVREMVEKDRKIVIVAGLDGTYQRKPFGAMLELLPFADECVKLSALCLLCDDGTPAPFTQRTSGGTSIVEIGGTESYRSVCRRHYEGTS